MYMSDAIVILYLVFVRANASGPVHVLKRHYCLGEFDINLVMQLVKKTIYVLWTCRNTDKNLHVRMNVHVNTVYVHVYSYMQDRMT